MCMITRQPCEVCGGFGLMAAPRSWRVGDWGWFCHAHAPLLRWRWADSGAIIMLDDDEPDAVPA